MKKYSCIYLVLFSLATFLSCEKHEDDLQGDGHLSGRLMFINDHSGGSEPLALGAKKVYIAEHPSDNLNYIYSVTTDAEGYFRFTNLQSKAYDVFYTDSIGGLRYHVSAKRTPDNDTVFLLATPDMKVQNGITFHVQDSTGSHIQGVSVYAYDSYDIYRADSTAGTVAGALRSFTTNQYGRDNWFNLAPATYYLIARKESSGVLLLGYEKATVGTTGMTPAFIQLRGAGAYAKNGLAIRVEDIWGNRLQNAVAYIYDSYDLYRADSASGSTAGAVRPLTTSANGTANWLNIVPRRYYVIAKKESGTLTLTGYVPIDVPALGLADSLVKLALPAAAPAVRITVLDLFNSPVSGADVYLYTSQITANLDTGYTVYTHKLTSGNTGIATATGIPAAKYFLKAAKVIADTTLKGVGLIYVKPTGFSDTTIYVQ